MKLHLFNPENDLALADGGFSYCPPPAAMCIAGELSSLQLWYAGVEDAVLLPTERHIAFRDEMSAFFELPPAYSPSMQSLVTALSPWGWSAQMRHRFKAMGFDGALLPSEDSIARMRCLSSRVHTIEILTALRNAGIDTPPMPQYINNIDDAVTFVNTHNRCVVKAPWSGSGKGIMWGIGNAEEPMVNFCKGVIRRQGGVVCEHFLNARTEFAMEFIATADAVGFAGYSLFTAENGAYTGNLLAGNEEIEKRLSQYIPIETLADVKAQLCVVMQRLLTESGYRGYFGVDMMIYDNGDGYRLNPCMEVNLRMNMGVVSRLFYDRFVGVGKQGIYRVRFFKQPGEVYRSHLEMKEMYPLKVQNSRITKGYINLVPVTHENRYIAYSIIGEDIC